MLGLADLMPDCWLEVSLHPEDPATGQPAQSGFSVVFLAPRANAKLVLKFHDALNASHAALPMVILNKYALQVTSVRVLGKCFVRVVW
jgi:hypothetical protein